MNAPYMCVTVIYIFLSHLRIIFAYNTNGESEKIAEKKLYQATLGSKFLLTVGGVSKSQLF